MQTPLDRSGFTCNDNFRAIIVQLRMECPEIVQGMKTFYDAESSKQYEKLNGHVVGVRHYNCCYYCYTTISNLNNGRPERFLSLSPNTCTGEVAIVGVMAIFDAALMDFHRT